MRKEEAAGHWLKNRRAWLKKSMTGRLKGAVNCTDNNQHSENGQDLGGVLKLHLIKNCVKNEVSQLL